jgi:hypothetical protein
MVQGNIIDFSLAEEDDDDDFGEAYDIEESVLPRFQTRRPFYASQRRPYYSHSQGTHQGTMIAPGSAPVPVRFGNVARADQVQKALRQVESDVKQLASAIKVLESRQSTGGIGGILPFLLLGQSTPEIEKITFSDDNSAPFNTTDEQVVSKTTYKAQKSNLGLILAMTMMGDSKDSNSALLLALAVSGGL